MKKHLMRNAAAMVVIAGAVSGAGPSFRADYVFSGSKLEKAWTTSGAADWTASNGTLTGTPRSVDGGWLMLDRSFQDAQFYSEIRCTDGCKTGLLFRAEKTPQGMKGIFVSLSEDDLGSYAVTIDKEGRIANRIRLEAGQAAMSRAGRAGGQVNAETLARVLSQAIVLELPDGMEVPPTMLRPAANYKKGEWNQIEILMHQDTVMPAFNGGGRGDGAKASGTVKPEMGNYGPIALYAGGTAPVTIRNLRYKDINAHTVNPEHVSPNFRKNQVNEFYTSWSAAAGDVNHDGIPDVIAGPYIYLGPDFKKRSEMYAPTIYNPTNQYPLPSMVNVAYDFTGDGWDDVLAVSGSAGLGVGTLYVNPRGESRHWDQFVVLPKVGNEETLLRDIDGDGRPEIIQSFDNRLAYSKYDPASPTAPWKTITISEKGPWGSTVGHGLGVGDINGDGLMDFINVYGWWEQPKNGSGQALWPQHQTIFGRWGATAGGPGGSQLGVYDVNGDGLADVVGPMEGHGFGLAWWEQKREGGKISFVEHVIMDNFETKNAGGVTFTEPHAASFVDVDGDGIPDMITGKRAMSHWGYSDPDPYGDAVLYAYKVRRNKSVPGGAEFVPELIHNRSGVGSHLAISDLNGDGKPDIVTSTIHGTFIFFNEEKKAKQ